MSTQPLLLTELNTWFERLGPVFHDKVREVFRLRYGSDGTRQEVMSYIVATYGNDRIKAIWYRLYSPASSGL